MLFQVEVKDLDRAKKFYEDLFGFKNIWYMSPEVGWTEFELPGDSLHLGLNAVLGGRI
ncbi:MAG: VOC family protein [Promethearchaeota archaeon]